MPKQEILPLNLEMGGKFSSVEILSVILQYYGCWEERKDNKGKNNSTLINSLSQQGN